MVSEKRHKWGGKEGKKNLSVNHRERDKWTEKEELVGEFVTVRTRKGERESRENVKFSSEVRTRWEKNMHARRNMTTRY